MKNSFFNLNLSAFNINITTAPNRKEKNRFFIINYELFSNLHNFVQANHFLGITNYINYIIIKNLNEFKKTTIFLKKMFTEQHNVSQLDFSPV